MLSTDEEDRLVAALPLEQTITYDGSTYTYEVTPYWFRSDAVADSSISPAYPALVFEYEERGERTDEGGGLGRFVAYDYKSDASVGVIERADVVDDLSMTLVVEASTDANGVPAGVRATRLGRAIWRFVRFELALDEPGASGERPMDVTVDEPPARRRAEGLLEAAWLARISYTEEFETVVDSVQDVAYDVNVSE